MLLGPLEVPTLSREQLALCANGAHLQLSAVGRSAVVVNGRRVTEATLAPGDIVAVGSLLLMMCVERPMHVDGESASHPFGKADDDGLVGESEAMATLRGDIAFVAPREGHVLIRGASGMGKELVARAVHRRSARRGPLVSRNAATIPDTLLDAELFGNVRGFPNPGMAERPGLVGAAAGGTLFLDEIAELPLAMQAHLLRVMDAGEYHRLGDPVARSSDLRVVGATNRDAGTLKHDLLARFALQIEVPPLSARCEDVPALLRHLAARLVSADRALARFFDDEGTLRLSIDFVQHLIATPPDGGVRGLQAALLAAFRSCRGETLDRPACLPAAPRVSEPLAPALSGERVAGDDARAHLQSVLDDSNGSIEKAWRALGLSSRFALTRLIRKYDLQIRKNAR